MRRRPRCSIRIVMKYPFLAFAGVAQMHMIASPIERPSSVRDILSKETLPPELLGSVMASAGFGLILATADRGIVYANDLADAQMRARNRLRCDRNSIAAKGFVSSKKLQSLIVAASRQKDESAQGGTLIMRDDDGASPLALHIVALCRNSAE